MKIYDNHTQDILYRKWRKLGWDVNTGPWNGHVDPEEIIIETTHAGRHDDRLFEWLLTFVRDYHDLINTKRLLRILDQADRPVLGAVFDIAMKNGVNKNFRTITEKCKPYDTPQILFHEMAQYESMREQEIKRGLEVYRKWGLFCTQMAFYDDAALRRKEVLKRNPLLALRALLGPNLRAEILFNLKQKAGIVIRTLSQNIGYAYSPVYNEAMSMLKSGVLTENAGRGHILCLSNGTKRLIRGLPHLG